MSKNRLASNAVVLLNLLKDKKLLPEDLSPHQRKVIVKYYIEEQSYVPNTVIGQMIGVTDVHVGRMKRDILRKSAWEIDEIDIKMLAVALKKKKEEYQKQAAMDRNWGLAWAIECEFIKKMQDLGFVYEAPKKHVVGTFEMELQDKMIDFFKRNGIPNVDDFLKQIESLRPSDQDRRDARKALAVKSIS